MCTAFAPPLCKPLPRLSPPPDMSTTPETHPTDDDRRGETAGGGSVDHTTPCRVAGFEHIEPTVRVWAMALSPEGLWRGRVRVYSLQGDCDIQTYANGASEQEARQAAIAVHNRLVGSSLASERQAADADVPSAIARLTEERDEARREAQVWSDAADELHRYADAVLTAAGYPETDDAPVHDARDIKNRIIALREDRDRLRDAGDAALEWIANVDPDRMLGSKVHATRTDVLVRLRPALALSPAPARPETPKSDEA